MEIFSKGDLTSKPRLGQNLAGEVIAQREDQHDRQPEEAGADEDPGETWAVADVHEKEQHQQRFARRDGERDIKIQPAGVVKGHVNGDQGQYQQRDENQNIDFWGDKDVL